MAGSLIDLLESFNRKERFFVMAGALDSPGLTLGSEFRSRISAAIDQPVDASAYAATDYHLDWLHAALLLHSGSVKTDIAYPDPSGDIATANQEDVDLLVVFDRPGETHVVLVEAKGYVGFTNKQLLSKAKRLERIFGVDGNRFAGVRSHFILLSPVEPDHKRLRVEAWPAWMKRNGKAAWLQLTVPPARHRITRCDATGNPNERGGHFRIAHSYDLLGRSRGARKTLL